MPENPLYPRTPEDALAEIEHILEQMLALAELSASDLDVNRDALQKTLGRLQSRIDDIADLMETE